MRAGRGARPRKGPTPRYRLRATVELFPTSEGDVFLLRTGGRPALVVRRPEPADRRLLEALAAEGVDVPAGSEDAARLAPLVAQGLVVEVADEDVALSAVERERFSRQLDWFAEMGPPLAAQRRLRDRHVVVLGCGGLGTWTLAALAGVGVGCFTVVDHDVVELSNLNRQILFGAADAGSSKADCAAAWLQRFDPDIRTRVVHRHVDGRHDLEDLVAGADVLVLAADSPPYQLGRWVNAACVDHRVPFIVGGQQPPVLKIGPTYAPGSGPCFQCHETWLAARFPMYAELTEHRSRVRTAAITLGPTTGVVGTLMALEVLNLLTADRPIATLGAAVLLDMLTLEERREEIPRDPACPACGHLFAGGAGR